MSERVEGQLSYWQKTLNLSDYQIILERISPVQVFDADIDRHKNPFIGVRLDGEVRATILHTRLLEEEDISHELVHLAHWDWPEEQVRQETTRLMVSCNYHG